MNLLNKDFDSKLPDFIYKYITTENAIKILENKTLWFTSPKDYNDPFDCNINLLDLTPRDEDIISVIKKNIFYREGVRREIQKNRKNPYRIKKQTSEQLQNHIYNSGVCCFSEMNNNNLMWAHYADNHKGLCLKFKSSIEEIGTMTAKVNYKKEYSKINFWTGEGNAILHLIFTKSTDWSYEREIRIFRMLEKGKTPFDLSNLTEIIFGCRTDRGAIAKIKGIIKQIGYTHIKYKQAKQSKYSFQLRID